MASQKQTRAGTPRGGGSSARGAGSARAGTGQGRTGPSAARQSRTGQGAAGRRDGAQRAGGKGQAAKGAPITPAVPEVTGAPRWLRLTTFILSIIGFGVSTYLTYTHFSDIAPKGCSTHGFENCAAVTSSAQSEVLGIFPVAVLGLAFYIFMVAVNSPIAWRLRLPAVHWARLGSVVTGIVFVLYLVYTELFTLNLICLYCTSVHIVTFLLFALIVFQASSRTSTSKRAD
jgi:uncharacterized membrane protein